MSAVLGWNITPEVRLAGGELSNIHVSASAGVFAATEVPNPDLQLVATAQVVTSILQGRRVARRAKVELDVELVVLENGARFMLLDCITHTGAKGLMVLTFWEWMVAGRGYVALRVEDPPREVRAPMSAVKEQVQ